MGRAYYIQIATAKNMRRVIGTSWAQEFRVFHTRSLFKAASSGVAIACILVEGRCRYMSLLTNSRSPRLIRSRPYLRGRKCVSVGFFAF